MLTIFFMIMYSFIKERNEKKIFVYWLLYIVLTIYTVIMSIRSYKGKYLFRRNQDYSTERKLELEKVHAYSFNNKDSIIKSDRCFCFHCKKIIDNSEIINYVDTENTALCQYCGIDSLIPDSIDVNIDEKLINDMHNYWF